MILTNDFVYLHVPKTAGTFVTQTLRRIYGSRCIDTASSGTKHGTCRDIPSTHTGLPIFASRRNPYERYVSQYHFGWWREHPESFCGEAEMRRQFPHYPDLSFADYLQLADRCFTRYHRGNLTGYEQPLMAPADQLGWHTAVFLRFFARNPRELFNSLDARAVEERRYLQELFEVRFLRTVQINSELHTALLDLGHDETSIRFVLDADRILPEEGGRPSDHCWQSHYTAELLDFVRQRERLLFDLFPDDDLPHSEILAGSEPASESPGSA